MNNNKRNGVDKYTETKREECEKPIKKKKIYCSQK